MDRTTDTDATWDVSRPHPRLWLTLALGLTGMLLFPFEEGFAPDAFAHARGVPLFAWMTAAFAGVWLLHRVEHAFIPKAQYLLMGLALVLSLAIPLGVRGMQRSGDQSAAGFFCFCLIVLLLIAGASAIQARQRPDAGSLRACLLRGPVLALTAPLLLYASRPVGGNTPASALQRLTRAAFAVLPHVLALGFALPFFLGVWRYNALSSGLGLRWQSFTIWACLGCALLFLLTPWPAYPRIPERGSVSKARRWASLATLALVAAVLLYMAVRGKFMITMIFFLPAFIWAAVGCAMVVVLIPWPAYPALPRLGEVPAARKMGALGTALFLALALGALGSFAYEPFLFIASGQPVSTAFDPEEEGGLDQSSPFKFFFLFVDFSAMVLPYVAAARWMGNRRSRPGYWAFALPTVVLCLCLLSILSPPFFYRVQQIGAMGWTAGRTDGLVCGVVGYGVVLAFLCWAVWPSRNGEKA
jgi:hypothetical protein